MPEDLPQDGPLPIGDFTALHDQAAAEVRGKATVVASYYRQLIEEGIAEGPALELTLSFQYSFLEPIRRRRTELDDDPPE